MARIHNQTGPHQNPGQHATAAAKMIAVAGVNLQAIKRQAAARPTLRSASSRFRSKSDAKRKSAGESKCQSGKKSARKVSPRAVVHVKRLPDMQRNRRHHLFLRMLELRLAAQTPLDQAEIRRLAAKCFEDTTQQFAGSRYAEEILREQDQNDAAEALAGYGRSLEASDGETIRAGLNISATAESYVESGLGGYCELRKFYNETVKDYRDLISTYISLRKELGPNFKPGMSFLRESMGADLSAAEPSTEAARLQSLIDDLYQVRFLDDFHDKLSDLIDRLKRDYSLADPCTAMNLTESVLGMVNQEFINPLTFQELSALVGLEELSAEIYLQTQLMNACREIPEKLFVAPEPRERLLHGFQMALDELIAKEEELENN